MKLIKEIDFMPFINVTIYIIIGIVVYKIVKTIINKTLSKTNGRITTNHQQRITTLKNMVINIVKYIIIIIVVLLTLSSFGINVTSIVAGLGITTAIIGLAFQDFAKDLISGFSIITEGQYEIGDWIKVDDFVGEVIFIGLKTTRIRDYKGATYIVANHHMDKVINYSLENSLAIIDISTAYEEKPDKILKALNEIKEELNGKIEDAKGEIEILGINELESSSVVYRVILPVNSMMHYKVQRILRKEIIEKFKKENIKIPYNQIEVHNGK